MLVFGRSFCLLACILFSAWLLLFFFPIAPPLEGRDFSSVVYDRSGVCLRLTLTQDEKYRLPIDLARLPRHALEKVLAYEDQYFWYHPGVNPFAIVRSLCSMALGGRRMGGSTITMQTVRLAYKFDTSTVLGKIRQIVLALALERQYSKAEILEVYFTLAPYGGNVEGLRAASLVYFHKEPEQLSRLESEALMLVPQNPVVRRPSQNNKHFQKALMREVFHGGEGAALKIYGQRDLPFLAPHFVNEVLAKRSGTIQTTLDVARQRLLEQRIRSFIGRTRAYGIRNCAALLVDWTSGDIRALVGSYSFFDASVSGQIDGTKVRRSPGSTLKPFIYALALEQGLIHPQTILLDTPKSFRGYDPENFDRSFKGPLPAKYALRQSRNIPAIGLAQKLSDPDLYTFLSRAGVSFQKSAQHYGLALVLGGAEVTMRELVSLYMMLANRGVMKDLRMVSNEVSHKSRRLLTQESAYITLSMLRSEDFVRSYSRRISLYTKTGTSNGFRDAWTCGIVGRYVLCVWLGNFDNSANPLLVGAKVAEPLFWDIAQSLAASEDMRDFFERPWPHCNIEEIPVCRQTGDVDVSLCKDQTTTLFIPGVSPFKNSGIYRKIALNTKTGLRACYEEEGVTHTVVWEFWPSEIARLFALAGNPKPKPPPFEPQCAQAVSGNAPSIYSPKVGLLYHVTQEQKCHIALAAHADADSHFLYWFIDGNYVAKTKPGETHAVALSPGVYHIVVNDDHGRSSAVVLTVAKT